MQENLSHIWLWPFEPLEQKQNSTQYQPDAPFLFSFQGRTSWKIAIVWCLCFSAANLFSILSLVFNSATLPVTVLLESFGLQSPQVQQLLLQKWTWLAFYSAYEYLVLELLGHHALLIFLPSNLSSTTYPYSGGRFGVLQDTVLVLPYSPFLISLPIFSFYLLFPVSCLFLPFSFPFFLQPFLFSPSSSHIFSTLFRHFFELVFFDNLCIVMKIVFTIEPINSFIIVI